MRACEHRSSSSSTPAAKPLAWTAGGPESDRREPENWHRLPSAVGGSVHLEVVRGLERGGHEQGRQPRALVHRQVPVANLIVGGSRSPRHTRRTGAHATAPTAMTVVLVRLPDGDMRPHVW